MLFRSLLRDSIEFIDRQVSLNIDAAGGWYKSISVPDIQNYLERASDGMAIEFIRFTNQINPTRLKIFDTRKDSTAYLVLGLDGHNLRHTFLTNGYELEHRSLQRYYNGIKYNLNDSLTYLRYFRPIEKLIGSAQQIYISADGVYNQVNLNTLFDGNAYLIDRYSFKQLTNLQELVSRETDSLAVPGLAVFFARPDYLKGMEKNQDRKSTRLNSSH